MGGACEVEVGPGISSSKLFQKHRRGNGARRPAAGILDVGDIRLDESLVLVPERKRPRRLARALARSEDFRDQAIDGREDPAGALAECDTAMTDARRCVR